MKKLVSIVLSLALCTFVFGAFIACGGDEFVEKDEYTVTFELNYEGAKPRVDTVKAGGRANYYAARRNGYTLVNWYTSDALKAGEEFNFTTQINRDYVLYAKWEKRGADINVTFDYNYPRCAAPVTVINEGGKAIDEKIVPDPNRLGYEVEGWYKDSACTQKWDMATDTIESATTLYAKYTNIANLKFDDDGNVILNNVDVDISFNSPQWTGQRGVNDIVDAFNDEYAGKVHLNWVKALTSEVARFEDPAQTNQYMHNNYRIGELFDLLGMEFDTSEYYANAIRENYAGDALMTFPVGHMQTSVMYNKAMLAEMEETVPATHADFVRVLEKAEKTFGERDGYAATVIYENEWQWFEIGSNSIWANNGVTFYSYDTASKKYVNEFAAEENKAKVSNAIKGYARVLNSSAISTVNSAGWTNIDPFMNVVDGNAFMAIVGLPKMYNSLYKRDGQLLSKVGFLPLTNLFNYGNTETPYNYVKGISLCLPANTQTVFDANQLAGIALFCKYLEKNSGSVGYNGTVPASKSGQNSELFTENRSFIYRVMRDISAPETFITLPAHSQEYFFFNTQNQAYVDTIKRITDITDQTAIAAAVEAIASDISLIIK